ncbi:U6 snRNA-associated Sm-like protein LSm6 like [Verticillium longisporum]|nr:U6 snRNA-associated Sm-like protein LSm6 like [Verticillium longisporum]
MSTRSQPPHQELWRGQGPLKLPQRHHRQRRHRKLNSGVVYKGELQSVDGYMNIALEKTEEYVNGTKRRSYGDAFVRGNNVMYISAD